jgi:hypothetical protein
MVGLAPALVANGYAVGAALLALWLFVRFPDQGPRTLRSAGLVVFGACGLLYVTGPTMRAADAAAGPFVALLAVFLPLLMFAFWSALRLVRATLDAVAR